jgi:uncharacterized RDD family membrane protein YckC
MAEEELTVSSLTGIDMRVRIAGPGTRSYAFLTDWLIRLLLALAWLLAGSLLRLLPRIAADAPLAHTVMVAAVILALATYFLYQPVLEVAMRGRTPGLRKAGARIATFEGATPGTGALLIRNVFRLIDALPAFYVVGLTCCMLTKQRVRLGDMVAGTVLVLDEADSVKSLGRLSAQMQRTALSAEALQLIHDLLDRWRSLEEDRRVRLARELLCKLDPGFDPRRGAALSSRALQGRLEALLAGESRH